MKNLTPPLFLLNALAFFFLFNTMYSQNEDTNCVTIDDGNTQNPNMTYSHSTSQADLLAMEPLVLNVFFWKVNGSNGEYNSGGAGFSEAFLLEAIASLNLMYNPYSIFFKYNGYDEMDTPSDLPVRILEDHDKNPQTPDVCRVQQGQIDPDGYGVVGKCEIGPMFSWMTANGLC